jgi:hypothetical protein
VTSAWTATQTVDPYSATLLVITGSSSNPAAEWDLNPDTIMVPETEMRDIRSASFMIRS